MKHPKEYIVFPLDVPSASEAKKWVRLLKNEVGVFKVGLELFITAGPEIVNTIHNAGAQVFLDLKLHDIPETVRRASQAVARLGVKFVTIHCGDSDAMRKAAVSGADTTTAVLGVTLLTSTSMEDLALSGYDHHYRNDVHSLVLDRARAIKQSGCSGVICSGQEVAAIKEHCGKDFIAITPGIRPEWSVTAKDDQRRITTPGRAIESGADYLVIGRPIRDSKDPEKAVRDIVEEISQVL